MTIREEGKELGFIRSFTLADHVKKRILGDYISDPALVLKESFFWYFQPLRGLRDGISFYT